jgi:hypothetical protein
MQLLREDSVLPRDLRGLPPGTPAAGARAAEPDVFVRRAGLASPMLMPTVMSGLVTERDFREAEAEFPGIVVFYRQLRRKPATFLDLLRLFFAATVVDEKQQRELFAGRSPELACQHP